MKISSIKENLTHGVEKVKATGKKALATLATVAALSGALASCDHADIHVDQKNKLVSTEFVFARAGEWPETFEVEIKKQGENCIAKIDGPLLDNHEFSGTKEAVFAELEAYFTNKAERLTRDPVSTPNQDLTFKVEQKMDALKKMYDAVVAEETIYSVEVEN